MSEANKMKRWDVYKRLRAWDNQVDDLDIAAESGDDVETEVVEDTKVRRKVAVDNANLTRELGIVSVDELFEPTVELVDYRDVLGGNILGDDDRW